MNIEKELTEIVDILENQRKLAVKSAYKTGEYGYGQVKSLHTAINLLNDLKKRWIDSRKSELLRKDDEISAMAIMNKDDSIVQIV
jgi:hypothetical protein